MLPFRAQTKRSLLAFLASLVCVCVLAPEATAQTSNTALPVGGVVSAGTATIAQAGSVNNPVLVIQQASDRAAINWSGFNIGRDATVNFQQPSAASVTLNRLLDGNPSQIFGKLQANGQVFLLNPSGIIFGSTASVDVGAIVASTHSMSDSDFMAGRNIFSRNGATGKIVNEGIIQTQLGGYIALLAPEVQNDGILIAQSGTIALAAGDTVTLNFNPANSKVDLLVAPSTIDALIENKKIIKAPGGEVIVSAQGYNQLAAGVIKNSGTISTNSSANSIVKVGGRILLDASDLVAQTGSVTATSENDNGGSIVINANKVDNSGILDVSTSAVNFKAGNIAVTGDNITLAAGTDIKAVGGAGGGTILIGGDWQGSGNLRQAIKIALDEMATIDASAFDFGNGGKVVLWSDVHRADSLTVVQGSILARGGVRGGNGGEVETSGHMLFADTLRVDAGAKMGEGGTWLIDPYDVTIDNNNFNNFGADAGSNPYVTYSYGSSSVANVSIVNNSLNSGTSVIVRTGDGGSANGVITLNAAISKTSGGDASLTLQAADNIVINSAISSSSGKMTVNLLADTDQNGNHNGAGVVILNNNITTRGGNLNFGNGSTLSINSVSTLVGGDVFVGGSSQVVLNTANSTGVGGGTVTVNGEMLIGNTNGLSITTQDGALRFAGVVNSTNSYELVNIGAGIAWDSALSAAKSGTGASTNDTYLATVTSRLENAIVSQKANFQPAWLGGRRVTGLGTDAYWRWVSGPEGLQDSGKGLIFSQQNVSGGASSYNGFFNIWAPNEPNNWNGSGPGAMNQEGESALQIADANGRWNDLPKSGFNLNYYIKETNLAPSPLTINAGSGTVTFDKQVGNQKALGNLSITGGSVSVAGSVVTEGTQTYNANVLVGASDLLLQTRGAAASGYDILLNKGITKSGAGDVTFTVKSHRDIYIDSNVSASGGKLNVLLDADYEDSGSAVTRDGAGFIQINGNIVTNGGNVQFGTGGTASIGGVTTQVGGDIYLSGSTAQSITTGGGSLNINGETMLANSSGLTITTSGGAVYFGGVLNSANSYQFIDKVVGVNDLWSTAMAQAKSGTGGSNNDTYIATITSRLENAIASRAASYRSAWLGGSRGGAFDPNASDDWYWVTGPEGLENSGRGRLFFNQTAAQTSTTPVGGTANQGAYINWNVNNGVRSEPNSTGEDYLQFTGTKGLWNDLSGTNNSPDGYIKERNAVPSPVSINAGSGTVTFSADVGTSKPLSSLSVTASTVTASSVTIDSGTFSVTNTAASSVTGAITGTGSLSKNGAGTLTLSGANSYGGSTTINTGTLQIGTGSTTGTLGTGNVVNNATLTFNRSDTYAVPNVISGNGNLIKNGTGMTALTGASTFAGTIALNTGTLGVYNNTALGTSTVTAAANTSIMFGRTVSSVANNFTLNGAVTFDLDTAVEYLIVGGGGGGGAWTGGAGGGGGVLTGSADPLADSSLSVTVGSGGNGAFFPTSQVFVAGTNGGSSGLASSSVNLLAYGGGVGASWSSQSANNGLTSVGSGGGGGGSPAVGGAGTAGQGNAGGYGNGTSPHAGGGGGGAGGAGGNGIETAGVSANAVGGTGGIGLASSISGSSQFYGGGGGGGVHGSGEFLGAVGGVGGLGGGGNGTPATSTTSWTSSGYSVTAGYGTANTGGGGGGAGGAAGTVASRGGNGGSGVVIARYLGSTAGSGGTVAAGSALAAGYTLHTFNANGTLALNSVAVNLTGALSGSGSMSANASGGTLKFSGNSSYTGNTSITGGLVQTGSLNALGNNSALSMSNIAGTQLQLISSLNIGSLTGGGATGGNVAIDSGAVLGTGANNTSTAYDGVISGAGGFTKSGNGTLTLTKDNSYSGTSTISAGTLQLGTGGTTGAIGTGDIVNNASLIINRSNTYFVPNLISGTGSLTKQGSGTTSLFGASTYSGGLTLSAGTLGVYHNTAMGSGAVTAAGGTSIMFGRSVTSVGNNFTLNGAVTFDLDTAVDYLIVGGGGGGGAWVGGGGGVLAGTTDLNGLSYTVSVGGGGVGMVNNSSAIQTNPTSGGNSTAFGFTAFGGGYGGNYSGFNAASGGSGGGQGGNQAAASGTAGQGFAGGVGDGRFDYGYVAGGGGGAGGVGGNATTTRAGAGGIGYATTINGVLSYFGGGGGGAVHTGGLAAAGIGGLGGGGNGIADSGTPAGNGLPNTGGGGGGAGRVNNQYSQGGNGGSGVVIARYIGSTAGSGGTVAAGSALAAGYTLHTFNSAGTLTLNPVAVTLTGALSGSGAMTADATGGTMKFSGNNSYTGSTAITGGVVQANQLNAFGVNSALSISNIAGTQLQLLSSLNIGSLAGGGTLGGNVVIGSGLTLNAGANNTSTQYDGVLSGAGAFIKNGTGAMTLTGTNSYTGGTTISAGTLQLGNGGSTGSVVGDIVDNGTLAFNYNPDTTVSNNISGSGKVQVTSAPFTLYSNYLTTTPQTVATNSTVAEVLYRLTGGRMNGNAVLSGGAPREAGAYVKNFDALTNTGTLQFQFYDTSYTKTVFIKLTQSGSNVLAAIDNSGSPSNGTAYNLANILGINMSSGYSFDIPLATVAGAGGYGADRIYLASKLTLSGTNTYSGTTTLNAVTTSITSGIDQYSQTSPGTLQVTNLGSGQSGGTNNGVLIFNGASTATLNGAMSGSGVVIKNGSSALSFTANQTYTGATVVNAGSLLVGTGGTTGMLASSLIGLPFATANLTLNRSDDLTLTSAIRGLGTFEKAGSNALTLTGSSQNAVFTIDGGSLIAQTNTPTTTIAGSTYNGPGSLTIQSTGTSFSAAYSPSGITFNSNLGGLTIGSTTNTADVTLSNSVTIAGPVTVYGGNITLNANLNTSGGSANGDVLLKATGNVRLGTSVDITTNGGDVTLWSDAVTPDQAGYIYVEGTSADRSVISTNGGAITLGGGAGTTVPLGAAYGGDATALGGVNLAYTTLSAGTADIAIRGVSKRSAIDYGIGVRIFIDTLSGGNITINGTGSAGYNGGSNNWGIGVEASTITGSGLISLTGAGGNAVSTNAGSNQYGIYIGSSSSISATGTGSITLNGSGGGLGGGTGTQGWYEHGILIGGAQPSPISTAGGAISITGTSGYGGNSNGVQIDSALSSVGSISIIGNYGAGNTGLGNIYLNQGLISSGSGAGILLKAAGGITQVASTTVQSNGGDITYWSNSTVDTSTSTAAGGIYVLDNALIDSRRTTDRIASNISTATLGGAITLGGGTATATTALGTTVPSGYALNFSGSQAGLLLGTNSALGHISGVKIYSGGGDILLSGRSTQTYLSITTGISAYEALTVDAGTNGNLTMRGIANGVVASAGIDFQSYRGGTTSSSASLLQTGGSGNLVVYGGNSTTGSGFQSGVTNAAADLTMAATGSGSVTLTGVSAGAGTYDLALQGMNVLARSGTITLNGSRSGSYLASLSAASVIGFKAGSSVTSSSSNIIFNFDNYALTMPVTLNTAGTVVVQSYGDSFGSTLSWPSTNLSMASSVSGLTLGKTTNTADVTIGATTTITGPLKVYGGNINVNANINTAAGGANGDVLLKATGDITLALGKSITTSGGDAILWANSDGGLTNGGVFFDQASSVTTGGGPIWIGGSSTLNGSVLWNGLTVGNGFATSGKDISSFGRRGSGSLNWQAGVLLDETTLNSGGGNIYIAGKRNSGTTNGAGLINYSGNGTLINAGSGTIEIRGESVDTAYLDWGVMTGLNPGDYSGKFTLKSSNTTAANAITLWGTTASSEDGILIENATRILSTAATNGGGISISGFSASRNALSVGVGGNTGTLEVLSASGAITVDVGAKPLLVAQYGTFRLGSIASDADVASSAANVTFTSDNPSWSGSVPIRTTGTLTVQPSANSAFSTTFNTAALNYTGITGLTIGSASNTGAVTVGSTTSVAGPVAILAGDINVNGNINTSGGGANGSVMFKSRGSITQAASVAVTTNGGNVTYWSNSDGETSAGAILLRDASSITTNGGNLWLGGGSGSSVWNGMTVGDGYAVTGATITAASCSGCATFTTGIYLEAASLQTAGGQIGLRARSITSANAIMSIGNALIDAGGGKLALEGISASGSGLVAGIHYMIRPSLLTLRSTSAASNAIVVEGTSSSADGIFAGPLKLEATNGGGISLTGKTSTGATGLTIGYLSYTSSFAALANSGPITINAGAGLSVASAATMTLGQLAGSAVTASSSNIELVANTLTFGASDSIASSGQLTLRPATNGTTIGIAGGAGSLQLPTTVFNNGSGPVKNGFSNIVIGSTDAGNVTFGGSLAFTDSATVISGGNITLNSGTAITNTQAGGQMVLAAGGNFINNAGSSAVSTTDAGANDRWIIYSANSANTSFGTSSLASGNSAVWGKTFSTLAPASVASGNRYVFSNTPTVTVQTTNATKTYGDTAILSGQLSVSMASTGTGAFTVPTVAEVFATLPTATSTGSVATATVSGGPYAITASGGIVNLGYAFTLSNVGTLTVQPRALTMSGATAANKVYDGTNTATLTGSLSGVLFNDAVGLNLTAAFASTNAGTGITVNSSSTLTGAMAGNYSLTQPTGVTANITKKTLTVSANNDAKFAGLTDAAAYAGVSYTGFVAAESASALTTAPTIARSNATSNIAGSYTGVLVPSGAAANNYSFNYVNGDYTIVPADQLLVRLGAVTNVYGNAPVYTVAEAKYMLPNNAIVNLLTTGSATVTGSQIVVRDAANASATFTVAPVNGATSTAGSLNAGSYQLTATNITTSNGANFSDKVSLVGSQTVSTKPITPAPTISKAYDGSVAIAAFSLAPGGLVSGDAVLLTGSGTFANKNAGTNKTYTLGGLALTGTDAANYSLTTGSTLTANNGTITQRALTVSGIAANDKVYDGATTATLNYAGVAYTGLVSGDAFGATATGTFASANAGARSVALSATVYSGADVSNYAITGQTSTAATITAKSLTLSGLIASNKVYDGVVSAAISSFGTLSGIVGADAVSLVTTTASSSFADKNVGNGKTVTLLASSLGLTGAAAGNYAITSNQTTTANITAKAITVSGISAADKVYDATNAASVSVANAQFNGMIANDALTVSASGVFADKNVSWLNGAINGSTIAKTVTLTSSYGGADLANYTITGQGSTSAKITPKALTVSGLLANSRVYDGGAIATVNTANALLSGLLANDVVNVSVSGAFANKNVGTGKAVTLTTTYSGADVGNYAITSQSGSTADITAKALTISGITAANMVYNGANVATVSTASAVKTGLVVGDTLTVSATGSFSDENVGTAKTVTLMSSLALTPVGLVNPAFGGSADQVSVTGTGNFANKNVSAIANKSYTLTSLTLAGVTVNGVVTDDSANYFLSSGTSYAGNNGQITPRTLTVNYGGVNKVYDGLLAASVTTTDNRVAGDALVIARSAAFSDKNAATGKTVSVSGVSLSGNDAGNYVVAATGSTTADVQQRALNINYGGVNKVYNGQMDATVTTADDRVAGDLLSIVRSAAFGDKNVAAAKVVSVSGVSLSGTDAGNYSVATTGSTNANITPRTLVVGYTGDNKVYDGGRVATVQTSDDRVLNDVLTISRSASFADKNVGTAKPVSVSDVSLSGTDANNYTVVATGSTTADITQKLLTVTYGGVNKVYDGLRSAVVTSSDDRVSGDALSITRSAAFSDKNAAIGKTVSVSGVSLSGLDANNYAVAATGTTTADITPRVLVVGYTGDNKVYDGGMVATVVTADDRVAGDLMSIVRTASFADKNVGTAKAVTVSGVSLTGTDAGNYTVAAGGSTTSDITPRALVVSYAGVSKVYDGLLAASVTTTDDRASVDSGVRRHLEDL
jgi:filamentous hemagglutinin family protein